MKMMKKSKTEGSSAESILSSSELRLVRKLVKSGDSDFEINSKNKKYAELYKRLLNYYIMRGDRITDADDQDEWMWDRLEGDFSY